MWPRSYWLSQLGFVFKGTGGYRFIGGVHEIGALSIDGSYRAGCQSTLSSPSLRHFPSEGAWRMLCWAVASLVIVGLATAAVWNRVHRLGPASGYTLSGKTLTVLDDEKRVKWRHKFTGFPAKLDEQFNPQVLFSDFDGDGETETLFVYADADERGRFTPSSGAELICFSDSGQLKWSKPFGTEVQTPRGRLYPAALYTISLLGRLRTPRADGGVIVAGAHHAGTWVYEVELYTSEGIKVGHYLHPGWLFSMAITDFNGDGTEEIKLGGVNNAYEEMGYSAALVVLNSSRVEGQGSTPPGDDRQGIGLRTATEAASILLSDFAPSPNRNAYCAVRGIAVAGGVLELKVDQGRPDLLFAYYRFDRQLRLASIVPELNYEAKLLSDQPRRLSNSERQAFFLDRLGKIKVIRNEFDPLFRAEAQR